jgi:antitoxin (DNA-binding transcriptional repressor) of toxin-antitoxin stability system
MYNNQVMAKEVIHISEAEAASDFASLLARVRKGAEIVIETDARPVAVLRSAEPHPGRLLSESIALAEAHGSTVTLDGDFGSDLEAIINSHHEPLSPPAWD